MSPNGYVQFFLLGLFCISAATATCTIGQGQSNVDMNKVHGNWFLSKARGAINFNEDKTLCHTIGFRKIDETTLEMTATYPERTVSKNLTLGTADNAGTWQVVGEERSGKVIYLSEDGHTLALAICIPNHSEPIGVLLSKQLPVSEDKMVDVRHAAEQAGIIDTTLWESEATCTSA